MITQEMVEKRIEYWRNILEIEPRWEINVHLADTDEEMNETARDATACTVVGNYFTADIWFHTARCTPENLNRYVVHELHHIILRHLSHIISGFYGPPGAKLAENTEEELIERLTAPLVKLEACARPEPARKGRR